jgi:hypothetical protein
LVPELRALEFQALKVIILHQSQLHVLEKAAPAELLRLAAQVAAGEARMQLQADLLRQTVEAAAAEVAAA